MGTSQENLVDTFCNEMDEAKEDIESMSSAHIYRVPKALRELNESAYTPRLVSIGPLHSDDGHLNPHMKKIKMSYLESLLNEMSYGVKVVKENMLAECVNKMKDLIDDAKHYYAVEVKLLDVKMLVTDGCFILEFLRRAYQPEETPDSSSQVTDGCCFKVLEALRRTCDTEKKPDAGQVTEEKKSSIVDPIFDIPLTYETVFNDLLLLENQLPFFVLQTLFECTLGRTSNSPTLRAYVLSCFRERLTIGEKSCTDSNATNCGGWPDECILSLCEGNNNNDPTPPETVDPPRHILHILYMYYLGDYQSALKKGSRESTCMPCSASKLCSSSKDMPSASDLAYKGVQFKSCKNLSEVEFQPLSPCCGALFRIPTLYVDDSTEPILRNLIALEQCCPDFEFHFTSYAYLMDRLVNTAKDVEELVGDGLIRNYLATSEEASTFFNKLCKGVTLDRDLYSRECKKAVSYSDCCMYRVIPASMTHLKCKLRASPWTSVAFFIAFVSFGISLTNFIRSW